MVWMFDRILPRNDRISKYLPANPVAVLIWMYLPFIFISLESDSLRMPSLKRILVNTFSGKATESNSFCLFIMI